MCQSINCWMSPTKPTSCLLTRRRSIDLALASFFTLPATLLSVSMPIRGLAQTMSRPTVQAFICLRHLCLYLFGCVDNCTVMTCTDHQGLLHYTPNEYTMEVYSDSDWAKHRSTRKSVSSGHICLCALSSAEAEIYAGVSACCDGKLMQACIQFLLEDGVKVEFTLNLDNSAAKAFFFRSGVGRIRHISIRVL